MANYGEWTVQWPYAVLLITLGVWVIYHFLAPEDWRDWSSVGLVQAFIIALYAEMYGFPLTIYLLTNLLPIEIPLVHSSGHLWATLLGFGRIGAAIESMIGFALLLAGLLLIVKGWVRVYFGGGRLLTEGVYGIVRHPQYLGVLLVVLGQLADWPTVPTLVLAPVIAWVYIGLARREETDLMQRFGNQFVEYRDRVPIFIPKWFWL